MDGKKTLRPVSETETSVRLDIYSPRANQFPFKIKINRKIWYWLDLPIVDAELVEGDGVLVPVQHAHAAVLEGVESNRLGFPGKRWRVQPGRLSDTQIWPLTHGFQCLKPVHYHISILSKTSRKLYSNFQVQNDQNGNLVDIMPITNKIFGQICQKIYQNCIYT